MIPHSFNAALRRATRPRSRLLWTSDWVCKSCRTSRAPPVRHQSTSSSPDKPYYITTPIFYVNAAPHVGHLYTMVLTDILKRWQVLRGRKAYLCTGTDEHGLKIQQAAARAQIEPREFCDKGAEIFKDLARRADLENDYFIRTSDADHRDTVQYVWHVLQERGYIYQSTHKGWYCVSDETFYPESSLEKRLDPATGRTFIASSETGKEVEWTSEKNYHFRLSVFRDRLLEFYEQNPEFVVPASRMNDVVQWVTNGLEDLSISRPSARLTWGIEVPGDEEQTIYVWLDALMNYITKAGYPWTPGQGHLLGWPADVHVIGKDIVRFHCIYWPAFLMALDIPLPKQVLTHAHWTMGHQKMAKSSGNGVNPFQALERFGVDTMRWYLAHDGGIADDSDYGNHHIVDKYQKGLQKGLGNLVSRITRPKAWSVKGAVEHAVQDTPEAKPNAHLEMLHELRSKVTAQFDALHPGRALHSIMDAVYETNRYLQQEEPWVLAKSESADDKIRMLEVVYNCAESVRIVGILLQPYMPTKAAQLLDMLGVDESRRTYDDAVPGSDSSYGTAKVPIGKCAWDALFPPVAIET